MALIQHFAQNTVGTDYVVGDIHGCFDQLQSLIDALNIDHTRDRIFSVGDLIDRGPYSLAALEWMDKSWFYACLGNHEQMLLSSGNPLSFLNWMVNGGEWWLQQDEPTREQFRLTIAHLPLAMEVASPCGLIGVVHADVPENMSWQQFTQALESDDPKALNAALWGRARAEGQVTSGVKGIDRVLCGHTILSDKEIHAVENVWLIDTGAFLQVFGGKLSLFPLSKLFTNSFAKEIKNQHGYSGD